ncbi:putative quinol monooxygenase [Allonocardiopsis opalescens]|uniref:Quinol monooxygenase YgiN n=1 Tax=Allonocardiopsis opalescens TaxID=1144618 RepID=A0A2T0Q7V5_9ACTN|nr:antibiotic biosynthesis monooxygenase [Allonocardiopsis opalescens]PRX99878.1 quinol monooxygenase YgiN [Allonocardiopsis opalescens]
MLGIVIAFIGALIAWSGTAVLGSLLSREPRLSHGGWLAAMAGMALALSAAAAGYAVGFNAPIFRFYQLGAGLFAPLALAWAIVELSAPRLRLRWAARLALSFLVLVPAVVLLLDPVQGAFEAALPTPGDHYDLLPNAVLTLVHVFVCGVIVAAVIRFGLRVREGAAEMLPVLIGLGLAAGAAVLQILVSRLGLGVFGLLLLTAAVGLVWTVPARVRQGLSGARRPARGRQRARRGRRAADDDDYDYDYDEGTGYVESVGYDDGYDDDGFDDYRDDHAGLRAEPEPEPEPEPPPPPPRGRRHRAAAAAPPDASLSAPAGPPAAARPPRPLYGMITIYSVQPGQNASFDEIMAQAAAETGRSGPDTLIYACHTVPAAPQQRIVYALYRDRPAYERHLATPHMRRFAELSRLCVAGSSVIELQLTSAEAAPDVLAALGVTGGV